MKWIKFFDPAYDAAMEREGRAEDEARLAQMKRLQAAQDAIAETRQGLLDVRALLVEDGAPTLQVHRAVLS